MNTNLLIGACISLIISIFSSNAFSQQSYTHQPLSKEDSSAINALVLYPDSVRINIFEACEYPAAIVNIAGIHKNLSNQFNDIVASYSKDEQENLYNLGRY